MRIFDSHLHFWDPNVLNYEWLTGPLAHRFAEAEVAATAVSGITSAGAVFVQAETVESQFIEEVRWVEGIARSAGVRGIVAGARLDRGAETSDQIEALAHFDSVVGVRHLLQGEVDGLAVSPSFVAGARELVKREWTFDACVRAHQISDVSGLADRVPELRIVLDHLGKPAVGTSRAPLAPSRRWLADLAELAAHPRVFCKLSGLPAEADGQWNAGLAAPFLDAAADAFGAERLMWGSDWPVSAIEQADRGEPAYAANARGRWADVVAGWASARGLDVEAIMWRTATEFYRV